MEKLGRVLFPLTFDDVSRKALKPIYDFARTHGATLDLLHVFQGIGPAFFDRLGITEVRSLEEQVESMLVYMQDFVQEVLGTTEGINLSVRAGSPASTILEFIDETQPSLSIMPTHVDDSGGRWFLGSVSYRVLAQSPKPVITLTPKAVGPITTKKVLVAVDVYYGIADLKIAMHDYFLDTGAEVELLIVVDPDEEKNEKIKEKRILQFETNKFSEMGFKSVHGKIVVGEDPSDEILKRANSGGFDMVVMNTHGRTGVSQMLQGSYTAEVVHQADIPVFTVKTVHHKDKGDFYHSNLPI